MALMARGLAVENKGGLSVVPGGFSNEVVDVEHSQYKAAWHETMKIVSDRCTYETATAETCRREVGTYLQDGHGRVDDKDKGYTCG